MTLNIVGFMSENERNAFRLACRHLSQITAAAVYRSIQVSGAQSESCFRHLIKYPHLASFVRSLKFQSHEGVSHSRCYVDPVLFGLVLEHTSQLESLSIYTTLHMAHFIAACVRHLDPSRSPNHTASLPLPLLNAICITPQESLLELLHLCSATSLTLIGDISLSTLRMMAATITRINGGAMLKMVSLQVGEAVKVAAVVQTISTFSSLEVLSLAQPCLNLIVSVLFVHQ